MEKIFEELIEGQKKKLWEIAKKISPHVTPDDLMQPNDFPELENHPLFRYEEGLLMGLLTARSAFFASLQESAK